MNGEHVEVTHTFTYLGSVIHSSTSCEPEVYRQLGVERDEFAGRSCVALPIFVQKDEGPSLSLAVPPGLSVFLRDLDFDCRAKTETELLWYYVASPNPWLAMA